MKLGLGLIVMVAALALANATHSFLFGVVAFVALFVGWKLETNG